MTVDRDLRAAVWSDASAAPDDRVADLISRMTLREKISQLSGVWLGIDATGADVAPHQHLFAAEAWDWDEGIQDGIGQLTRPYGTAPVDPLVGARGVARRQAQIRAANRFGIPALVHEECLTGLAAWQATVYPSPLCWGASFDPDLVQRMGARIGHLMRALGVHQGLAPVLDVVRDLRWGRVEEAIGEDPLLVGAIGAGYVRGLQSADVIATVKHFVGYSGSRAGRNLAPVSAGPRELADVYLPPFEMALRAGARSVMNSYTDIDGVPVAADGTLLTDLLRGGWEFAGTVVADYFSVAFLESLHGVARNGADAAGLALAAGIDVELPMVNCYGAPLEAAVMAGGVDVAVVDRAVARVLRQKCELGMLDPDWNPEPSALQSSEVDLDDVDARLLARDMAHRSIVLLSNDGRLPLASGQRVAVVGPRAHAPGAMFGCYSFPLHVGVHHPTVPIGIDVLTLADALRADPAGYEISYAQGCPVVRGDDAGIADAVRVAAAADVCVLALGDEAGLFGGGTSGEGCDVAELRLPGRQEELLEAVLGTGTPVVLVLLVGRPYELARQVDRLAAVVCAFYPGEEGGPALADVLSGRVNPSGRLPVSFPAAGGGQPGGYLAPRLGQRGDVSVIDPTPLFAFGYGLSYGSVTWVDTALVTGREWPTDGECTLAVTLRNDGPMAESEVVQVYLHDPVGEVVRPVQQLIAFGRVELAPSTTRTVRIDIHADLTSYTGRVHRQVDPGDVELWVGRSSGDIVARLGVTLIGPARTVGFERVLQPTISVGD
ncbi:MAG TPA: glycoside hydrolase family 3 N-terminal domain-containing protein [Jatrophihabitans sp.]|nr:glycoside hydrolase family 3 N-terminal domain-containing protein [Jatrophihabitans sp.]